MSGLALIYQPEGYDPAARMMGRQVASAGLLKALARHWPTTRLTAVGPAEAAGPLAQRLQGFSGRRWEVRAIGAGNTAALTEAGTLYRPDPVLADEASLRAAVDPAGWSIVGITHTVSSLAAERALAALPCSLVEPWDALICTSSAVKGVVEGQLVAAADLLSARLGAPISPTPCALPVIPLGVHPDEFETESPPQQAARRRRRAELCLDDDVTVALFVGRLVFHAKANPYPLFTALQAAAQSSGRRFALVLAGWSPNEAIRAAFVEGARALCPQVPVHLLDGRDPAVRREVWALGDLFISLVDNIQETFGLTPVEAMAAGLPVIVSDWDGYREAVNDGVEGFLIPTVAPPPGAGALLAQRHVLGLDGYDRYIGAVAQSVSVDASAAAARLVQLAADPALRRRMGAAGRARVAAHYDWARVLRRYEALFAELAEVRRAAGSHRRRAHPLHADPFTRYAAYPTAHLGPATRVVAAPGLSFVQVRQVLTLRLLAIAPELLLDEGAQRRLWTALGAGSLRVDQLLQTVCGAPDDPAGLRTIVHLSKAGLVALEGVVAVRV